MARAKHWQDMLSRTETARAKDAVNLVRRSLESPQWKAILQSMGLHDLHPENWHRRIVEEELGRPEPAQIYFAIKRAMWRWPEFAGLGRGAAAILRVVIELAREEAFPWYLPVAAEEVRRLARMSTRHYCRAVPELQELAITRPARIIHLAGPDGMARFPGTVDEREPPAPIPQWVVRYRHGTPFNKKRAAWWINYDLLCETGRVQRCFVVSLRTLSKPYRARNRVMGPPADNWFITKSEEGLAALEEALSKNGPLPRPGLRAPLWRA